MTTKAQEREALEQIKELVKGLGSDSYVGAAFDGCFEVAEENIENDFFTNAIEKAEGRVREDAMKTLHAEKAFAKRELDKVTDENKMLKAELANVETTWKELHVKATKAEREKLQTQIEKKNAEIVHLKAVILNLLTEETKQ